jgi:diguanylate cyclase (GGDEF)-like protein/PAS domain S-box-containing protein
LFEDTHLANTLIEDGRFVAVNKAALRMLRMNRPDQLLGLTPDTISPPLQPDGQPSAEKAAELIRTVTQQGSIDFEWEHIRADGERFLAQVSVTVIRYHNKDLLHNVWHDITEQKKTRQQIEHMAFHDSLTGLPNRVLGHDRLQHAVATASQHHSGLAVLCLDLNKFKYINDTHGHVVGDLLLKGVALRLTRHLRAEDTLCRLSADAFMMVLPEVQSQHLVSQVVSACERLLASLAEPFELEGLQLLTSISIGVAIYPQDGSDSETLIRHSDTALFEAKKAGHHTYRFFEPQMNAVLSRFVKTRAALQSALEHQEFELYYQPQVDLRRRRVVGVESLIRWRRPDAGLTLPDAFIDVAEESGLIVPIGRWVLHEACRQAAAWHAAGWTNLVMAVNLSAVQFRQRQVSLDVVAALEDSGLDPTCLDLELTESILLQNETAVLDTVAAWKARGIQLSIDDFGTGYSSLAYLKRFKVDKLKIDRSFIINLLINEEDRAIVQAIIQIARSLNLRTIAEGVEDALMADQLKIMGCDEIQGYLYSKPLPAAAFEQWLDNHRSIG